VLSFSSDSYTASISDSKQSREIDLNRYVAVFRSLTLHALTQLPTTIASSIASLRQFLKQTVLCYAVQQWPTHTQQDISQLISNVLLVTLKQYTFSQSNLPVSVRRRERRGKGERREDALFANPQLCCGVVVLVCW